MPFSLWTRKDRTKMTDMKFKPNTKEETVRFFTLNEFKSHDLSEMHPQVLEEMADGE